MKMMGLVDALMVQLGTHFSKNVKLSIVIVSFTLMEHQLIIWVVNAKILLHGFLSSRNV